MKISATVKNELHTNRVTVATENKEQQINIPAKAEGLGSSVNGGELLFLALATCFCNDTFREAARRKMKIKSVEVTVSGDFGNEGEAARNISYKVKVLSPENTNAEIQELIRHVDSVAEIHNTLRKGVAVSLEN